MRGEQPRPAVLAAIAAGARLITGEAAFQVPDRPHISEVQVFKYFGGAPLPLRMRGQLSRCHVTDCVRKHVLQLRQFRMHTL